MGLRVRNMDKLHHWLWRTLDMAALGYGGPEPDQMWTSARFMSIYLFAILQLRGEHDSYRVCKYAAILICTWQGADTRDAVICKVCDMHER